MIFRSGRVVTPDGVLDGAQIDVEDGHIRAISAAPRSGGFDLEGGWLMPGFIDTQVNGGGGVLFNDAPDVESIRAIATAHAAYGTTALFPTLISDSMDKVAQALDAVDEAIAIGVPGVVGAHIEGPFLNTARKGIHDARCFRRLDSDAMALLLRPRRGRTLLTLAPELCAPEDIATLAGHGVTVSAGHSDADYATVMAAIAAGMRGFTHLFNAMSPLHHREPGMVGAAFDSRESWTGLIADGAHVHPAVMRIALHARPRDRIVLVSDAMPSVGAAHKDFILQGKPIRVANGICVDEEGTLAGSDLDMAGAVRNIIAMAGASPEQASAMASSNPAEFMGLADRGRLETGRRADWVWLDGAFRPKGTWVSGRRVSG